MNKQITKKQHYVPQFYLRKFTDEKGFLHVYNTKTNQFFKSTPKDICFEKFLYETEIKDNDTKSKYYNVNDTEHSLEKLENTHNTTIESLINKCDNVKDNNLIITEDEKSILAEFVSTMYYRHPKTMIRDLNFVAGDEHLKNINVHPGTIGYNLLKSPFYHAMLISKIKDINLFQLHNSGDVSNMIEDLKTMNLTILKSDKRKFITSSFPVNSLNTKGEICIFTPISLKYSIVFTNMKMDEIIKDSIYEISDFDTYYRNFDYFTIAPDFCEYIFADSQEDLEEYYEKLKSYL